MLYITGIVIAFFLSLILLSKKNKSLADKLLATWLFFTGFHLLLFYVFITGQYVQFPFILGFDLPLPLVHGPFLFIYVCALTGKRLTKAALLHAVPFVVANLTLTPFFALPAQEKISVYQHEGAGYELLMIVLYSSIILSGVVYALLALRLLHIHQKNIGEQFSYTEKINLAWLRYLIFGSVIIWLVVIFGNDASTYSAIVLYIVFIGYFGIKQTGIFTNTTPFVSSAELESTEIGFTEAQPEKIKYEKSGLTDEQLHAIHQQLIRIMQTEKLYAQPDLALPDLAKKLAVHPNVLSQVINTCEQKSFFDYINGHRVEAFKQLVLLPENQKFTLLALAFDCGFNSKTSFNRNFKKVTGLSPSEYLKSVHVSLS